MANFAYYNITTAAVTTISAIDQPQVKSITLCNKDASGDACTIDMYIDNSDSTSTIYILHDVVIPGGSTLVLEKPEIDFDVTTYALKLLLTTVSGTQLLDVKVIY